MDLRTAADIGRLDPEAIARVRDEAQPAIGNADELHDAMLTFGCLTEPEVTAPADALLAQLHAQGRATRLRTASGVTLHVAAERLHEFIALFPDSARTPSISAVHPERAESADALREILRNRMELLGPVTIAELARQLDTAFSQVELALLQLEAEGAMMRGAFTAPEASEWCDRRLLARIHRYTRDTRRAEIRAVAPSEFLRFLFRWQGVAQRDGETDARSKGDQALLAVLQQLEGFPAPAIAWEQDILPARIGDYLPLMLDRHCAAGRITWARPAPAGQHDTRRKAGPIRTTPVFWSAREHLPFWQRPDGTTETSPELSPRGERALDALKTHGASFHSDLLADTGLLGAELETALGELVSQGLVTCDSFAGLRALLQPSKKRGRPRRRPSMRALDLDESGRWSLTRRRRIMTEDTTALAEPHVEHIARTLLARYGVVFRRMLDREDGLPPWRDLYYVYRRLEARGEIRGGRFVSGFSGEQFALPEAAATLRSLPEMSEAEPEYVSISAADPLNLAGILTPGDKVARLPGNRVLFRNGTPVAKRSNGEVQLLTEMDAVASWDAHNLLIRGTAQASAPTIRPQ